MSILLREARNKALESLPEGADRNCEGCAAPFVASRGFERLCPVCFKLDRGYTLYASDKALLRLQQHAVDADERARTLEKEAKTLREEVATLRNERAKLLEPIVKEVPGVPLTSAQVKKLLVLCHPDKHGGSPLATRVTQWLNAIRARNKAEKRRTKRK